MALRGYAHDLGLAFQIADDLLDCRRHRRPRPASRSARTQAAGKATFVSILGVERARAQAAAAGPTRRRRILICSAKRRTFCEQVARFRREPNALTANSIPGCPVRGDQERTRESISSSRTPLLDQVDVPGRSAQAARPNQICASSPTSCAPRLIDAVSVTGGHLGAGLGVVELTVALHYRLRHAATTG